MSRSDAGNSISVARRVLDASDTTGRHVVSVRFLAMLICLVSAPAVFAQWGYDYHSSTLEEGVQRGFADVVRSQGMANLYNAQAATEAQKARSSYLDNQYKATQTYFEMRRYNTEARRAERSSPLSTEQYVR